MLDSGGLVSHRNSTTQLYFPWRWWTRILAATATGPGATGDGGQMDDGGAGEREGGNLNYFTTGTDMRGCGQRAGSSCFAHMEQVSRYVRT
jgi:hypothetical protein